MRWPISWPISWSLSCRCLTRRGLLAAALLVPATMLHAARPATDPPEHTSLVGQLLIAAPSIGDPRFQQTVILMVRHDRNGAYGIVINRPLGERPWTVLLQALGEKDAAADGSVRIFMGGPVQPEIGFVVHSSEYHRSGTIDVDGHVAVTSSREILNDIAHRQGPKQALVAFGYAGWGAGQLEGELAQRAWFMMPADARLIFETDRDAVWDEAMKRRTQEL
jgi:putative transcriptional regulator